ncbi:hypothetical protein FALB51S_04114 [Frigidibacter albus]
MISGPLTIGPEPGRTGGGYAQLRLPAGSLDTETVAVSVYGLFRERYIGVGGWQSTPSYFGPYPVKTLQSDEQAVTIGPEIVNSLEEFLALRFDIGGYSADVTWPDAIQPAPGMPSLGQVLTPAQLGELIKDHPENEVGPTEDDPPQPPVVDPNDQGGAEPWWGRVKRHWWLAALMLLALATALMVYFFAPSADRPPVPVPVPVPACSAEAALASSAGPRAALTSLLKDQEESRCTGEITADFSLFLLQDAVAAGSAEALLLFGHLYNDAITDPLLEERLGLILADDAAQALDYYARAAEAGAAEAGPAIEAICEITLDTTDPLVAQARRDFCP